METTATPFDLNRAIQQWRDNLNQSPAFRRENLDELDSHLRDSIANLQQRGLAEEEAFLIAVRRAGAATVLGTEFGKINARAIWLNRALWMLVGFQVFGIIASLDSAVSMLAAVFGIKQVVLLADVSSRPLYTGLLYALVRLLVFAVALTIGWRWLTRKGNGIAAWLRKVPNNSFRLVATIAGGLILTLLARAIGPGVWVLLQRSSGRFDPGQFLIPVQYGAVWVSFIESAALILLTFLLARRQLFAKT